MRAGVRPVLFRALGMLIPTLAAAGNPAAAAPSPAPSIIETNTAFALDLYQRTKDTAPNLFFSPYSISTALAMTWAGARGATAEEMARTLHFTQPASQHQAFGHLHDRFDEIDRTEHIELSTANSLWMQSNFEFKPEFVDLNREYYQAELRPADFARQPEAVRQEINSWIAKTTRDKIRDLLQPGQVDSTTRLLLCNAIYFKGDWATQFDEKATRPQTFFLNSNQTVSIPTMSRNMEVRSRAFDNFIGFALPYAGKDLAMIVLLPKAIEGLAELERELTAPAVRDCLQQIGSAPETEAEVTFPKLKLKCRLDLARDLAGMGMPTAFSDRADFSGMTGQRNLRISGVVHEACVDVNEQGTEAAAATGIIMRPTSVRRKALLHVDRPFLFIILDQQTGGILFFGRVTNPIG